MLLETRRRAPRGRADPSCASNSGAMEGYNNVRNLFAQIASRSAYAMGHYWAFIIATFACIVWAVSGPLFGFSDTWQLVDAWS